MSNTKFKLTPFDVDNDAGLHVGDMVRITNKRSVNYDLVGHVEETAKGAVKISVAGGTYVFANHSVELVVAAFSR